MFIPTGAPLQACPCPARKTGTDCAPGSGDRWTFGLHYHSQFIRAMFYPLSLRSCYTFFLLRFFNCSRYRYDLFNTVVDNHCLIAISVTPGNGRNLSRYQLMLWNTCSSVRRDPREPLALPRIMLAPASRSGRRERAVTTLRGYLRETDTARHDKY